PAKKPNVKIATPKIMIPISADKVMQTPIMTITNENGRIFLLPYLSANMPIHVELNVPTRYTRKINPTAVWLSE
ncbi:hypothetical protein SB689_23750, partial [Chryseobacterium sp. SIMBA_038]